MKNIQLILITLLITLCFACSEDDSSTPETQNDNFYALTVGNSWEYRWYNPQQQPYDFFESISIVGTEIINNNEYYKFKRIVTDNTIPPLDLFSPPGEYFEFYRDSLGFLVNEEGIIKFTNNTTDEFLIKTYENFGFINGEYVGAAEYGNLSIENNNFTTNAGTFDCLEMIVKRVYDNGIETPGKNYIYYADGIGLVSDDQVHVTTDDIRRRRMLESYNVQ